MSLEDMVEMKENVMAPAAGKSSSFHVTWPQQNIATCVDHQPVRVVRLSYM